MTAPAIVFDVNETLLDLSALDPLFADAFGDKGVRRIWFAQTLQIAMTMTIMGAYAPFGEVAKAALQMTAHKRGVALDRERERRIMRGFAVLPAHGDAPEGLARLRDAGFRLAVLAQATSAMLEEQLEAAKIRHFFEFVFSSEMVRRFKPAQETYALARERLGGSTPLLVAAHDWDVAGAMSAGWEGAFVARHGTALNPLSPAPTIIATDLRAIANAICARVPAQGA
jgi:2-haloacid dehalogenase